MAYYSFGFEDGASYPYAVDESRAPTGWTLTSSNNQYVGQGAATGGYGTPHSGTYFYNIREYLGSGSTGYITKNFGEDLNGFVLTFYYMTQEDGAATTTSKVQFLNSGGSLIEEHTLAEHPTTWSEQTFTLPSGTYQIRFYFTNPSSSWGASLMLDDILIEVPATNFQINIGDAWKAVPAMWIKIGDEWRPVESAKINISDEWKTIF